EVLLHVQPAAQVLHAHIVHHEVIAGGDGADAVENIFADGGARQRVDDHVGVGQHAVDGVGDGVGDLLGALEGDVAAEADDEVGEVAIAGAANAHACHFE